MSMRAEQSPLSSSFRTNTSVCWIFWKKTTPPLKQADFYGSNLTSSPAAYDTLSAHFRDTGRSPSFYDLIVTGDLGKLGYEIVCEFFQKDGVDMSNYNDCGLILFDCKKQDVHCGASGCGCSAAVLTASLIPGLLSGKWQNILFCPTGALLSPTSTQQGESVPGVCHAVAITTQREEN